MVAVPSRLPGRRNVVPLATLHSAIPDQRLAAKARLDPFFGSMLVTASGGLTASWMTRRMSTRFEQLGIAHRKPVKRSLSEEEALDAIVNGTAKWRRSCLEVLGALSVWRTATSEQVAAIIGDPKMANEWRSQAHVLWAAGLVQEGTVTPPAGMNHFPRLYRLDRLGPWEKLAKHLRFEEWLGVIGARQWGAGASHDRHNLIATEIGLRIAEFCRIGTALGETPVRNIVDPSCSVPARSPRAADGVVVRRDGLRIAIEATAAITGLDEKVSAWADILSRDESRSTVVVFVDIWRSATEAGMSASAGRFSHNIRQVVARESSATMARVSARVPERIGVIRWEDWFPGPGLVDDGALLGLTAEFHTGPREKPWAAVDLLDPSFNPVRDPAKREVITNARSLYGVPHWLRSGEKRDWTPRLVRWAGLEPAFESYAA